MIKNQKRKKQGNRQKNWWFEISVDLLKLYLGVSAKDYKQISDFQRRCIRDPIDEINNAECKKKRQHLSQSVFHGLTSIFICCKAKPRKAFFISD